MTSPNPIPDFSGQQKILDNITSMVSGSPALADEPGVVWSLAQANAHPADAASINEFLEGLNAEKQVRLAGVTGQKLLLDDHQKALLGNLGINYAPVEYTQQDQATATANSISTKSNGALTAVRNPDGTIKTDNQGNVVTQAAGSGFSGQAAAIQALDKVGGVTLQQPKPQKASGLGRLFHTLNNDVLKPVERDVLSPVGSALSKPWNVVTQTLGDAFQGYSQLTKDAGAAGAFLDPVQGIKNIVKGNITPKLGNLQNDVQSIAGNTPEQDQAMKNAGYDPSNPFSLIAYRAKGLDHYDNSGLIQKYGQPNYDMATQFLKDPTAYTQTIENNASNYTTDPASGRQVMTAAGKAQLAQINSPEFQDLTRRIAASNSSIGSAAANSLNIDPVKNPGEYALTSAAVNLAASFMLDPTILAGKAFGAIRASQVGTYGLDMEKIAKAIDPAAQQARATALAETMPGTATATHAANVANEAPGGIGTKIAKFLFLNPTQQRINDFITASHSMASAAEAGDAVKAAGLQARIATQYRELSPLVPDVLGSNRILGYGENGAVYGTGDGIHNLYDFAGYMASKGALVRVLQGGAMKETSLMPGAASGFGARKLRGLTSQWLTERSAARSEEAYTGVLDAARHDPALANKLLDEGTIERFMPATDDAVDTFSGQVLADKKALEEAQARLQSDYIVPEGEPADYYQQLVDTAQNNLAGSQGKLASAQRAQQEDLRVTDAGKGQITKNLRARGNPLGDNGATRFGWASPTAVAARTRLVATRLTTNLARNNILNINDSASADKVYKIARLYMNRGDAEALRVAWNMGDGGARKNVILGLRMQLAHASGLAGTESGDAIIRTWGAETENYSSAGDQLFRKGQPVAMSTGQANETWTMPDFRKLHQASAKVGLWDMTMGRPLTSAQVDAFSSAIKMGWLGKPSTISRNMLEGWLRTGLEGQFGEAIKTRIASTMRNSELWKMGLSPETEAKYNEALEAGDTKLAEEISNGSLSAGQAIGRSRPANRIANTAFMSMIGNAFHRLYGKTIDPRDLELIDQLGAQDYADALHGFGQQATEAMMGSRYAANETAKTTSAGYGASLLSHEVATAREAVKKAGSTPAGVRWTHMDTDETVGAERYSNALHRRVDDMPAVSKMIFNHLGNPQTVPVSEVVKEIDALGSKANLIGWGTDWWPQGSGNSVKALTDGEKALGKEQYAKEIIRDHEYLTTGQNGAPATALRDYISSNGKAPDPDWIVNNLKGAHRPETVSAPEIVSMATDAGLKGMVAALQDVTGAGYQWFIERALQRTTTGPVFLANWLKARRDLDPFVTQLVEEHGLSTAAAQNLAKEVAVKNAWVQAEKLIDDPGQRTQFDIVARNMFPFSRATTAMIRRWGGGLWQDPTRARKMMLAYEGATQSGLVYNNAYGEPTFTYPGSGVFNMALRELAKVPGFENLARFPVSASMTGGVLMSVPGADNPFRMSAGPMITIPMREIAKLLPGHDKLIFDDVDSFINGPVGQGETFSSLEPTLAKKFFAAMSTDDRNSALASSMMGAIANLAAAGRIPPPNASASDVSAFIANVRTQTRSQLFLRAIFGAFAPAAPSQPSEGTAASKADYAFNIRGVGQLSDEYKAILNDVHGDLARATAIWTAMHPDQVVYGQDGAVTDLKHLYSQYTVAQSQASAAKVSLPSTQQSLEWMVSNADFIRKYGNVAPYFLPEADTNAPFSDSAYRAQLELGLRIKKTPTQFLSDLMVRNAEAVYYPSVAQFDAKIAAAKQMGDKATEAQWTNQKSLWEKQFKAQNPYLGQKIDGYSDSRVVADKALSNIREMIAKNQVPNGQGPLLQKLVKTYDDYEHFSAAHPGSDQTSVAQRSAAKNMVDAWVQQNIAGSPLADLYNGVFRVLNTNLINLSSAAGGY